MSSADFPATASARSSGEPRVAVVTGASAGIGEATARTLAAQGFHVVAVARRADRINALAAEIGRRPGLRLHVIPLGAERHALEIVEAFDRARATAGA